MKVKNLTPFPFGAKSTSLRPPRREMTLIARASYVLSPGEPLRLPESPGIGPTLLAQGPMAAERYREEDEERAGDCLYPGDFADHKSRAEVLLRGACHTPGGKPLTECPVRFEVGKWSKILRVTGRRFWSDDGAGAVMSEPAPFTSMPLAWTHAFGGPGYAQNPVGKGFGGRELPNVEHAGNVIRSRRDEPPPAGLGPINPAWPQRAVKLGKEYGPRWRKERWPYYAEDFDIDYFQSAPPDQWLPAYLRGDETLFFQNLHPAAPVFETRLPGLRIRAFVKDEKARFREVAMNLDTLFADLEEGRLYLTYRGLEPVETDDLADVATVLLASEPLGDAPLPEQHYRDRLEAFEADPLEIQAHVPKELLDKRDAMEQRAKDRKEGKLPAHDSPPPDPATAKLRQALDALPLPFPGAKDLEQKIAAAVAKAIEKAPSAADVKAKLASAATLDLPPVRSAPVVPLRPGGPPPAWAARSLAAAFEGYEKAKEKLATQKLPADQQAEMEKMLAEQDERIAAMKREPFFKQILNRPAPVEPGPQKDLSGQDYEGRNLAGADLSGASLRDANLAGADLRGAKLVGACLDGAVLVDADLTGADLSSADLTLANLSGAQAKGAVFRGATLNRAFFQKANLAGAVLAGAKGEWTFLPEASLAGADGKGLSLHQAFAQKAVLEGADLSGATLTKCHFGECQAKKVNLSRATLTGTSFQGSDLTEATLIEARGSRSAWLRARLHDADFRRAVLPNAFFFEASADRARFRRAVLKEIRCYRGSFNEADFTEADLLRADFTKCKLGGTSFARANLYDSKFHQAAGEGCDFSGANLKRAAREGL